MKINFTCEYLLDLPDCKHGTIICAFTKLLPMILADFFSASLCVSPTKSCRHA